MAFARTGYVPAVSTPESLNHRSGGNLRRRRLSQSPQSKTIRTESPSRHEQGYEGVGNSDYPLKDPQWFLEQREGGSEAG